MERDGTNSTGHDDVMMVIMWSRELTQSLSQSESVEQG